MRFNGVGKCRCRLLHCILETTNLLKIYQLGRGEEVIFMWVNADAVVCPCLGTQPSRLPGSQKFAYAVEKDVPGE